MRIAIYGTGGVGGLFGGKLALAGEEVVFFARGAHLEAMRRDGLRLRLPDGERTIALDRDHATDDPLSVAPVDAVLVCVKTWQVEAAARAIGPLLGPETFVVPLQNGVEAARTLSGVLGSARVVGGLCGTVSFVEAPGVIRSVGTLNLVRIGELGAARGAASGRCERLCGALERAGVSAEIPTDIEVALWEKFLFVVPFGGVGAVSRSPIGVIRSVPETRAILLAAMAEIEAVGRFLGVALPIDALEKSLGFVERLAPEATTSLHRDLAAGRPSELEAWNGAVVRLGRDCGVPTPVHSQLYGALLPLELRARGRISFAGETTSGAGATDRP